MPCTSTTNIVCSGSDITEPYLTAFDNAGIKIILQVEPMNANVNTLIGLVMNRYKQHPSVIGFGVDLEYNTNGCLEGCKPTAATVTSWNTALHAINPNYVLMIKHYDEAKIPTGIASDILIVGDDESNGNQATLVAEHKAIASQFPSNPYGAQIGYWSDHGWWGSISDPSKTIGTAVQTSVGKPISVFWVDMDGSLPAAFPYAQYNTGPIPTPTTVPIVNVETKVLIGGVASSANIYIDNVLKGTSSDLFYTTTPGTHTLKVTKTGYVDSVSTISVASTGTTVCYSVNLIAVPPTAIPTPTPTASPTPTPTPVLTGAQIYANTCQSCHGALATSSKRGRTAAQITTSMTSVGSHSWALTSAQITLLANALAVAPTPTPTVTSTATPTPTATVPPTGCTTLSIGSCKGYLHVTPIVGGVTVSANIYINDAYQGNTETTITLDEGQYNVKVTKLGYNDIALLVNVTSTKTTNVNAILDGVPTTTVTSPAISGTAIFAIAAILIILFVVIRRKK
jgi:hypothetical protein